MPHDESFIHRNRAVKASNGLFNNENYRIISTNRYENFEVHEISSNATVDITTSNYHRNFRQITLINFREITEFSADSQQFLANHPQPKIETNSAPREILNFSNSIPKRIRWKEFSSCVKFGKVRPFSFAGSNLRQLSSDSNVNLESSNSERVITHAGINDHLNGSDDPQNVSLIQNIGRIIEKCRFYGIKSIFWSSIYY